MLQQELVISSLHTSERIITSLVGFHGNSKLTLISKLICSCCREWSLSLFATGPQCPAVPVSQWYCQDWDSEDSWWSPLHTTSTPRPYIRSPLRGWKLAAWPAQNFIRKDGVLVQGGTEASVVQTCFTWIYTMSSLLVHLPSRSISGVSVGIFLWLFQLSSLPWSLKPSPHALEPHTVALNSSCLTLLMANRWWLVLWPS